MITNKSFERALHKWELWIKAVEDARTALGESDAETCYAYAGKILNTLRLPAKLALRVYFLSCVFSSYKHGDYFVFGEIRLPPPEKCKPMWSQDSLKVSYLRPYPPAILTKKDVHRLLDDHSYYGDALGMSLSAAIREIFAPRFIVLDPQHPIRQIGSKMKRCMDTDVATKCAKMAESMKYEDINRRYGWKPQKGAYWNTNRGTRSKRNRFPTVRRYVRLGKKLLSNSPEESKIYFLEYLPDSMEQIACSMNMTGLRTQIDQAFSAAIARARG